MPEPASLRLVNPETGEITDHAELGRIRVQLEGAERDIRSWRARYAHLKRDLRADQDHDLFPAAKRLFDFWRERCNHPRSEFTPERFKDCLPHLRDLGEETCRKAIEGAAYDCYTTIRKNGTVARHDSWGLIFRSRDKVEDMANRAPHHLPKPEHVKTLADALMHVWKWELAQAVAEAQRRLS